MRPLILSWEYPPLIEGGLARHVRKLAENMAAQGLDVHVLARGREEDPAEQEVGGVLVHRVRGLSSPAEIEARASRIAGAQCGAEGSACTLSPMSTSSAATPSSASARGSWIISSVRQSRANFPL